MVAIKKIVSMEKQKLLDANENNYNIYTFPMVFFSGFQLNKFEMLV